MSGTDRVFLFDKVPKTLKPQTLMITLSCMNKVQPDVSLGGVSLVESFSLRGLAMVMIILSHYSQYFIGDEPVLKLLGVPGCAIFFFLSGYGMSISTESHKSVRYFVNKIGFLYATLVFANILFVLCFQSTNHEISYVVLSVLGFTHIFVCDWYIIATILMYVCLFIVQVLPTVFNTTRNVIALLVVVSVIYILLNRVNASSILLFPLGYYVGRTKLNLDLRVLKVSTIVCVVCFLIRVMTNGYVNTPALLIVFMLYLVLHYPLCYYVKQLTKKSALLRIIGKESMAVYYMQGLSLLLIREFLSDNNLFIILMLLMLLTAVLTYFFSIATKVLISPIFS